MLFSSVTFLFCFLPITTLIYFVTPAKLRNFWLFAASLVFYAWPDPLVASFLIGSILMNWIGGLAVASTLFPAARPTFLLIFVVFNLFGLVFYKYFPYVLFVYNLGLSHFHLRVLAPFEIPVPIGISFFTFHAISYLVDIYRGDAVAFKNPLNLGLYIAFFPQLIAGPIVRFQKIAGQIRKRVHSSVKFAEGAERFIYGLAKKSMVADPLGEAANHVFALPFVDLSTPNAWFGLLCYSLQIYFDFSGYSDMAVGLGKLFGFELPENFNYPYCASSLRDFWRRWHISLSTWFRDYLYIPLGGNQGPLFLVSIRLFTVFLLCGIWHGTTFNFALWGLYHGFFLAIERGGPWARLLTKMPLPLRHVYTLLAVAFGWVLFRSPSLPHALSYFQTLLGLRSGSSYGEAIMLYFTGKTLVPLAVALLLSVPLYPRLVEKWKQGRWPEFRLSVRYLLVFTLFFLSAAFVANETVHPFLYFRF